MIMRLFAALGALAFLSACASDEDTARFLLRPIPSDVQIAPAYGNIEMREVSLPEYAASPEVFFQTEDGALRSSTTTLWADAPTRAVTAVLVRDLGDITGATIAAEPWPLVDFPDARLEVRVSDMYANVSGVYRLSGQYFITTLRGASRDRTGDFDLSVPIRGEGYPAIVDATSRAVHALALTIAREGLAR